MKPSLILLGLILGTAGSILFSLVGVAVIFLVLGSDYPRLEAEADSLFVNLGMFTVLTVFAALSFYSVLKARPWRAAAVVPLIIMLAVIGWYYWPD
ncbi:MAG: hypothetical protein JXB36_01970 [Gammaproteobacteria bacterium]|nr:hypothetical protein [Gammaproteobacteria bacterium]